jgi:hypothetical protein
VFKDNGPSWGKVDPSTVPAGRPWVAPVNPGGSTPPPPDDTVDKLKARIAQLETEKAVLRAELQVSMDDARRTAAERDAARTRVGELEAERDDLKRQVTEAEAARDAALKQPCETTGPGWARRLFGIGCKPKLQ